MRVSPLLRVLLLCLLMVGVVGCGSGPAASAGMVPVAANLAGNWLLAGSLPQGFDPTLAGPQLSMTLSVVGQQIVGTGVYDLSCPAAGSLLEYSGGGSVVLSGLIAADGSFLLQTPTPGSVLPNAVSISVQGTVPTQAGGTWQGSIVIDTTGLPIRCPQKVGMSINAAAIAPVSGKYVATGSMLQGTSSTPITLTMKLAQGIQLTSGTGQIYTFVPGLSGTITAQGISCFQSGTLPAPSGNLPGSGGVFGGLIAPIFKMNDGSSFAVQGSLADSGGTQLQHVKATALSGACSVQAGTQFRLGNFERVP